MNIVHRRRPEDIDLLVRNGILKHGYRILSARDVAEMKRTMVPQPLIRHIYRHAFAYRFVGLCHLVVLVAVSVLLLVAGSLSGSVRVASWLVETHLPQYLDACFLWTGMVVAATTYVNRVIPSWQELRPIAKNTAPAGVSALMHHLDDLVGQHDTTLWIECDARYRHTIYHITTVTNARYCLGDLSYREL